MKIIYFVSFFTRLHIFLTVFYFFFIANKVEPTRTILHKLCDDYFRFAPCSDRNIRHAGAHRVKPRGWLELFPQSVILNDVSSLWPSKLVAQFYLKITRNQKNHFCLFQNPRE